MERERLDKEAEAETLPPQLRRETSIPASTSASVSVSVKTRDLLKRYGLALALPGLALYLRAVLALPEGTAIYQLPIAAVVLSAWYGGRGPGWLASLVCAIGVLYWFVPPVDTFELSPDYAVGFFMFIALILLLCEFSATRRHAERALRASEQRFRTLVQFSFNAWYWETDAQHRFTRLDLSEWQSDWSAFPSAQIGKTRWEHPYVDLDEQGWREHRATIDAHLPFRDFERAIPTADGGTRYHAVSGLPVFDEAGRFVGYRGVGRDITDRKRAETEHRQHLWFLESLDRVHRAIQSANDLETIINAVLGEVRDIFQSDRAVFSVFGNRKGTLWYRRLAIELRPGCEHPDKVGVEYIADQDASAMRSEVRAAGRPVALVLGSVPPHVARSHAHFGVQSALSMTIEGKQAGLEDEDYYSFTIDECSRPRVWTDEEMRLFEEIGRRLGDALTKLSTLGALQRRDAYLSEAQRLSQSESWAWNAASNGFVHWSRGRLPLLGPDSGQFPTVEEVRQSIHPEDRDAWSERFTRAIRERSRFELEYRSLLPDGSVKHFRTVAHPVLDGSGGLLEFVGTVIDITAEKRAEAEQQAHVWFLESMDRINRAMQGTNEVEQMMSGVLDTVLEVFACDRAWLVYPCDPDAPSWRAVMEHTRPEFPGAFAQRRDVPMTAAAAKVLRTVLDSDGAVPAGPGHERGVESENAEQFGVRSQMLMALYPKGDRPYAFGLHQCSYPRTWTREEQRLFEEIGHRLTEALTSLIAVRSLRESERRSEAAQKIAHVGWWERDYVNGRVSLSDEACRIFGVQPLDLPQWQDRWVSLIHPDDRDKAATASEKALRGGPRYDVEYRVVRPDGTVRIVHSQGDVTFDDEGRPLRQFGAMQDITELRRAEHELRRKEAYLAEAQRLSHTGSWAYDPDGSPRFWSDEMYRIYGLDPQEPAPKREQRNTRIHPDDRQSVNLARERLLRDKVDVEFEHRLVLPDGTSKHVYVRGHPVLGSAGEVLETIGTTVDMTERKRAQEELRASEARFRTFVDHARDAFFLIDEHLIVVDVNRQACENLGYRRQELIGMHPSDFDVGLDQPSIDRLAQRAEEGEVITFETRHRRKDGTTFPVEIRSGTFRQGGKLFYLALARDITERKRAEDSLRQSEMYLAEAQRLSHTGSWALDVASDKYVYTSEESDRIYGYDPQGEPPTREAVFERIHPDDRSRCKRNIERSLREKVDTLDEYRIVLPEGTVRHIRAIRHPVLNNAGEVVQLIGTSIDITERKLAEESVRESQAYLTESQRLSHTGSWALDAKSNQYLYTSEEFDRLFGFDTRGEALTRDAVLERMHPEDRATWNRHLEKSFREKVDTTSQYRLVLPDGRIRHIHTIRHPVLNSAGEVVKLVGTSIDITERKQAEEERERLRRLETELAHAHRLNTLGELTSSIAHEVSQPLGAMVASAGACTRWLATDPPAMAEARSALVNIVADGRRARDVIARIRALAKRQAPRMDLLDVNRKILDVLSFVDQELGTHEVILETRLDNTLPKVVGDRVQLQQVILNLVKNAIEAMSGVNDRRRELTIVSARRPDGVVVEVRDSGIGLDAHGAERLFEAFYTTKPEGLGVGLSISRSMVEAHGGRLWAAPNQPHGAVFAFSLPVAKEGQS